MPNADVSVGRCAPSLASSARTAFPGHRPRAARMSVRLELGRPPIGHERRPRWHGPLCDLFSLDGLPTQVRPLRGPVRRGSSQRPRVGRRAAIEGDLLIWARRLGPARRARGWSPQQNPVRQSLEFSFVGSHQDTRWAMAHANPGAGQGLDAVWGQRPRSKRTKEFKVGRNALRHVRSAIQEGPNQDGSAGGSFFSAAYPQPKRSPTPSTPKFSRRAFSKIPRKILKVKVSACGKLLRWPKAP